MDTATFTALENLTSKHGFGWWGIAPLEKPHTFEFYRQWLDEDLNGEMKYLRLHLPKKENPQSLLPHAHSSLVVAVNYLPHPAPLPAPLPHLPIARYAQGEDYHDWLKERLNGLAGDLQALYPAATFLAMTDSHPVMERDLAQRAGLGWFGKNSCLIHPKRGSFFLLGEIYTSLSWEITTQPQPDHCGSCRRCIEACPTGAILGNRTLDARLCISYWTIENRQVPPVHLRDKIGEWFLGCDICQEVCPWNQKVFTHDLIQKTRSSLPADRQEFIKELRFVLTSSNRELQRAFAKTALNRPGARSLRRNAILVATRSGCLELREEIRQVGLQFPILAELCQWSLDRLNRLDSQKEPQPG